MRKAILLSKFRSNWEIFLLKKLSYDFNVEVLYLTEMLSRYGARSSIEYINAYIEKTGAEFLFLDIGFYPIVDKTYVDALSSSPIKIALFFDDLLMHEYNSITVSSVDVVLTADPISALKYQEKGLVSYYFPLEADADLFRGSKKETVYDVLFFGSLVKSDRREWISFLEENGIKIKAVGPGSVMVPFEEMASLIRRSKIVLDLSKSSNLCVDSIHNRSRRDGGVFCYYYQMKGRPIMSGLAKTCCVSEYTPALRLLFNEDELPVFENKSDCLRLIQDLLVNEKKLNFYAENLAQKVYTLYEDRVFMQYLAPKLIKRNARLLLAKKTPLWYRRKAYAAKIKGEIGFIRKKIMSYLRYLSSSREDLILRRVFGGQGVGFYVDVGAHHPKRFSNTYLFYERGWHGININAVPGSMKLFDKIRPRDINLEMCIGSNVGEQDYYIFDEPALNGFSKDLSEEKHKSDSACKIRGVIKVQVKSLSQVLDTHLNNAQEIDFLSVDVEGLDSDALKSNNWSKYRPKFVLAEILGSSLHEIEQSEIGQFMRDQSYVLYAKCMNTVFFKDSLVQ